MIQLLFTLLAAEAAAVLLLLVKTPLRKLVVLGIDRAKRGRGPIMVKTVGATVFVVLLSSVYSMEKIHRGAGEGGALTPTDQVLWSRHLLEASLMGFSLFLALIIDRLHHYIRELRGLKKNKETAAKENKMLEEVKSSKLREIKQKDQTISSLKQRINEMESKCSARKQEAEDAEAKVLALKKSSEGSLLEYDRLLEDNQNLLSQLHSINSGFSDDNKKNS